VNFREKKMLKRIEGVYNVVLSDLLFNVLIHGTSYNEKGTGKGVSMNKQSGDIILFFNTDNDLCKVKQNTANTCDLLIFVSNENKSTKILALVELKGSNIEHAIEQIKQTYLYIHNQLKNCVGNYTRLHRDERIKWIGIILTSGSSPKNWKKYVKEHGLDKLGIELLEPITHRKGNYCLDKVIRAKMK